jgi:hypothetical protein
VRRIVAVIRAYPHVFRRLLFELLGEDLVREVLRRLAERDREAA